MPDSVGESAETAGLKAVELGIVAGVFACLAYPLAAFAHLPKLATTTLVACFGPALAIASYGLRQLLDLATPRVSSALGLFLNALAGALYTAMGLLQLALLLPRVAIASRLSWLPPGSDSTSPGTPSLLSGPSVSRSPCCGIPASDASSQSSGYSSVVVRLRFIFTRSQFHPRMPAW